MTKNQVYGDIITNINYLIEWIHRKVYLYTLVCDGNRV